VVLCLKIQCQHSPVDIGDHDIKKYISELLRKIFNKNHTTIDIGNKWIVNPNLQRIGVTQ
jgi:hypothetical protein